MIQQLYPPHIVITQMNRALPLPTSSGQQARPIRQLNQTLAALHTLPAFPFRRYGSTA